MFDWNPQPIGGPGVFYLCFLCLLLPWLAWKAGKQSKNSPAPSRTAYFANALITAAVLGTLALLVAQREGIELFPSAVPPFRTLGLGMLALVALVVVMAPYRKWVARTQPKRMQLFCEPTLRDRAFWSLVSLSAGFWEEIVYRGVVTVLLARWTGSVPVAVGVATIAFAGAHLQRGVRGAAVVAPIGLVLHGLVFAAGSLYVAMAVHFLYDVAAGFAYMDLANKLGITRSIPVPPPEAQHHA